jgi:sugar lactone lactonase YvrE
LEEVNAALEGMGMDPLPDGALDACVGAEFQSNPVPTDVEIGPDGNYYVSALPGFPESAGAGAVFRISRSSGAVTKVAGGFTGAVDLAVTDDGTIYVAELFGFQVSRVDPGDDEASASTFVECPTAIEADVRGQVWVAEGGICTDGPPAPGRIVPLSL